MPLPRPAALIRRLPLGGDKEQILLELDLAKGVAEAPPASPIEALRSMHTPLLRTVIDHLRKASDDASVTGLIAHVGNTGLSLAQSGELRAAVASFRAAGKATVAHAETFGELGPDSVGYHLASAFEEIWLQPSGTVGLAGFAAEALYLRRALDKLGIVPQIGQRYEYKSAADLTMRESMSEPVREMMTRLVESAMETVVAEVASARGVDVELLRDAALASPLSATRAHELGLIDQIGYRDQAYAAVRARLGAPEPTLRYVERYAAGRVDGLLDSLRALPSSKPVVGIVQASGPVVLGRGGRSPMGGGHQVASDRVCAALRAAARETQVKAVVLRVDSPGGSYVASDAIRREVIALREAGKPVVASMASVAASGGYFIAMPADRVLASAGTITGSIGVLGGKAVLQGALDRVGVHREAVRSTAHADMFSTVRPFDAAEFETLNAWLDEVYADFTTKAAADRGLDVDDLRAVAKGRVWTGVDALERGLVDELGGLAAAIDAACSLAGLKRATIEVRSVPKPNPIEQLLPAENSESAAAALALPGAPFSLAGELAGLAGVGIGGIEGRLAALAVELGLASVGPLSLPAMSLPGLVP